MSSPRFSSMGWRHVPACLLLALVVPAAAPAAQGRLEAPPSVISGTLRVDGCALPASGITLRAVSLAPRLSGRGRARPPVPASAPKVARLRPTRDPHAFEFSFVGLLPASLYQLRVSVPRSPCGRVFWRGPLDGLAVSGGPAVAIEGVAATTEVEILQPGPGAESGRLAGRWVGTDNLEFTDPGQAVRTLRWRTRLGGVVGGELQVSRRAFPTSGSFSGCDEPTGEIIYRQRLPAGSRTWTSIGSVDFGQILRGGRTASSADGEPPTEATPPLDEAAYGRLVAGAPLFLRVLPITADGPACGREDSGVPGWVVVAKLPGGSATVPAGPPGRIVPGYGQLYLPPYYGQSSPPHYLGVKSSPYGNPSYGEVAYKVVKPHLVPWQSPYQVTTQEWVQIMSKDPFGASMVHAGILAPATLLLPGDWLSFTPNTGGGSSGGILGVLTSTFGALVTGLAGVAGVLFDPLTYLADMTSEIKDALASAVVDVATMVPGVGPVCDALGSVGTSCEDVVKAGMEYGLASMGMPPSLPSWNPNQGLDYLAAELASEVEAKTGIPAGLTEDEFKSLMHDTAQSVLDKMDASRGQSNGVAYDWVVPYMGFDPAVWSMMVQKTDGDPLPPNLYIRVKAPGFYRDANVHVPASFPSDNVLRIPVFLQPDASGLKPPLCLTTRVGQTTCTPLPFQAKQPFCASEELLGGGWENGMPKPGTWQWVGYECWKSNVVPVYFRDTWIQDKIVPSDCIFLGTTSATATTLWLPFLPPFAVAVFIDPKQLESWNGGSHLSTGCPAAGASGN